LVPAVDEVDKNCGALRWEVVGDGRGNETFILAVSRMDQEVEASADSHSELAFGKEYFGEGVSVSKSEDAAGETAPGSADAYGTKLIQICFVFV
jgi:hypothetical protein